MRIFRPTRLGLSAFTDSLCCLVLICGVFFSLPIHGARINHALSAPGIAWNVKGAWHVEGIRDPILIGDAVPAGALLEPEVEDSAHSITILLPDGQSILYECFTAKDCSRGFRVPDLFREPDPSTAGMLRRIRARLREQRGKDTAAPAENQHIAKEEAVAQLGAGNRIEIGGLAAKLSNGKYSGALRSFDARYPEQTDIPLEKSGSSIALTVPGPGLFLLTITDSMKWPRIEFMIAAVPPRNDAILKEFQKEHELLAAWKEEYFGWPIHDFQRAYLESLMLNISPDSSRNAQTTMAQPPRPDATAEPAFTPTPGLSAGNLAISLHCATPGATIHYTEDSSQPMENSHVYHAPIIMKTMPITIKAFAEAPGKKDSSVVTGNFRIASP